MTWPVTFYSSKVEAQTLDLPKGILANFLRIVELLGEFGPDLGRPHQPRWAVGDQEGQQDTRA